MQEEFKFLKLKEENFFYRVVTRKGFTFTEFFKETRAVIYKGLLGFNSKVVAEPIVLFTVDVDIESPIYSKEECKSKIKKAYKQMIFENERKAEIEKGEII